ncbi:hypothetical protein KR084_004741, partial [Drosophila pseudotakahashii]
YGNFYALWLTCKLQTEQIVVSNAQNAIITLIGRSLLISINTRNKKLLENDGMLACLYLDPRFHHILNAEQKQNGTEFLKTLWKKIIHHDPKLSSKQGNASPLITDNETNSSFDILHNYLSSHLPETPPTTATDVNRKIETLNLSYRKIRNVLNFWLERKSIDPELYELSQICFAMPPTQVYIL